MNARSTIVCALGILALSCSGDDGSSPTSPSSSSSSSTGTAPQVIEEAQFTLPAPIGETVYFWLKETTTMTSGAWEATVDWTSSANTLYMYVATGSCAATDFALEACPSTPSCPCQFAVRSETATPKPRVLADPNTAAGTRTLIIVNLGPAEEAGIYSVRLKNAPQAAAP